MYSEWQPMFESEAMKEVEFVRGIDEQLVSRENLGGKRTLLFLDDVADEIDEKLVAALFTKLVVISSKFSFSCKTHAISVKLTLYITGTVIIEAFRWFFSYTIYFTADSNATDYCLSTLITTF